MRDASSDIADFWLWWADARQSVLDCYDGGAEPTFVAALSERVDAIHPDLQWEFGPGRDRPHQLTVTAVGDPALRVTANRWQAAAPDDPNFEFYTARQRHPELMVSIDFGTGQVDFAAFRVGVRIDDDRQRFDLFVYHPQFSELHEDQIPQILWVVLDNALGEDAVVTWIGEVEWVRVLPQETEGLEVWTLAELRDAVDDVASRWPEDAYVVARAVDRETGADLIYTGCRSAKYLRHPGFDTLCLARLPYADRGDGMPGPEEAARLDVFQDVLEAALGDQALVLCRSTGDGHRRIWMYLQAENGPERRILEEHAAAHTGPVELRFSWDPGWRAYPL